MVFSTFDMDSDQPRKSLDLWKGRLEISKLAKFESVMLKTNNEMALQSREIWWTFVWWGASLCHLLGP